MRSARLLASLALALSVGLGLAPPRAWAGVEPFLGEICIYPFNFIPPGWMWCDGQLLPINQNAGLFSLLQDTYGGDGESDFALPDLRGRTPVMFGQGPGLALRNRGVPFGNAILTLMAPTTLPIFGTTAGGRAYPVSLKGGAPVVTRDNRPPFVTFYFHIAIQGTYPPSS